MFSFVRCGARPWTPGLKSRPRDAPDLLEEEWIRTSMKLRNHMQSRTRSHEMG